MSRYAEDYFKERGVTLETVLENGIEIRPSVGDDRVLAKDYRFRLGGLDNWHGTAPFQEVIEESIWFACRDANGTIHSWILRPFPALPPVNGSGAAKFLTPRGGNGYPFILKPVWDARTKTSKPIVITEGPVKGLALYQAGALPVALNGVWMGVTDDGEGKFSLRPELQEFQWLGRTVYLCFDADQFTNPDVLRATIRTAFALTACGAQVCQLTTWPIWAGKGIDDYLVQ
jgi:hypothetical protein